MPGITRPRTLLVLLLAAILLLQGGGVSHAQGTSRTFPQTGYTVDNDAIWNYFQGRGGVDTFGYPVSRTFQFRGFPVQIFQRNIIQVVGQVARPMNLLDPDLMPLTRFNGSVFPAYNPSVAAQAPAPSTSDYGTAVTFHLRTTVPNGWNGVPVGFYDYYFSAAPASAGNLRVLLALEVWGFPTSIAMRDPGNSNFIYQRFQRGIMHYDATTGVTRGILLGDAFKSLLTGSNLPADLATELSASPFLRLYDPNQPSGLAREVPSINPPITRANTNLSTAFMPGGGAPLVDQVKIFLVALEDNGQSGPRIGCNDSVVGVTRMITPTTTPLRASIEELLSIKDRDYGESGFYNALYQSNLQIESLTLENGKATIRLVGQLRSGGVCDDPRIKAQIEYTALQFSTVTQVEIFVNGTRL